MNGAKAPAAGARALRALGYALGVMVVLQLLRMGLKSLFFVFVERTNFTDRVASLVAMALLSAVVVLYARARKLPLSVFPKRFGAWYIVASALTLTLLVLTPILTKDDSFTAIVLLIYSGVVTPVFEELIFRGLLWNRLNDALPKAWMTYAVTALLFALWHFGYVDALAFRVHEGLGTAMLWKAVIGLGYGVALGALRLGTKNCYSTMLLHGALNIFGR